MAQFCQMRALASTDKNKCPLNDTCAVVEPNLELCDTAALLQLGVSDLKRVQVDKVR